MFKKAVIIGCPGAGKSTFARKLHKMTNIPLYYLDMIWHREDKTTVPLEEFDAKLAEILERDSWIIDGNYQRTLAARLEACDAVFLFDIPLKDCLNGAAERIGKKREDLPWIEEEFDEEFKKWIEGFPENRLPQIYETLEKYTDKDIYIFKSRSEADEFLKNMGGGGT